MLRAQRATGSKIPIRPIRVDRMPAAKVDQVLQEQFSRQDVTRPRNMESEKEPLIGHERKPQPNLLAACLDPRLIDEKTSNTPNGEAIVHVTEALNPTPNRDMTPPTEILQARRHGSQTQTSKVHIDAVEHDPEGSPPTFNY